MELLNFLESIHVTTSGWGTLFWQVSVLFILPIYGIIVFVKNMRFILGRQKTEAEILGYKPVLKSTFGYYPYYDFRAVLKIDTFDKPVTLNVSSSIIPSTKTSVFLKSDQIFLSDFTLKKILFPLTFIGLGASLHGVGMRYLMLNREIDNTTLALILVFYFFLLAAFLCIMTLAYHEKLSKNLTYESYGDIPLINPKKSALKNLNFEQIKEKLNNDIISYDDVTIYYHFKYRFFWRTISVFLVIFLIWISYFMIYKKLIILNYI